MRVWSGARAELQSTFVAAMDYMRTGGSDESQGVGGQASGSERKLGALDLARVLCQSYVNVPVKSLILDDEESQSLRRVASCMSIQYEQVVLPLKKYLETQMKLPIVMHEVVRDTLSTLRDIKVQLCATHLGV